MKGIPANYHTHLKEPKKLRKNKLIKKLNKQFNKYFMIFNNIFNSF